VSIRVNKFLLVTRAVINDCLLYLHAELPWLSGFQLIKKAIVFLILLLLSKAHCTGIESS